MSLLSAPSSPSNDVPVSLPSWLPPADAVLSGRELNRFLDESNAGPLREMKQRFAALHQRAESLRTALSVLPEALRMSMGVGTLSEAHLEPLKGPASGTPETPGKGGALRWRGTLPPVLALEDRLPGLVLLADLGMRLRAFLEELPKQFDAKKTDYDEAVKRLFGLFIVEDHVDLGFDLHRTRESLPVFSTVAERVTSSPTPALNAIRPALTRVSRNVGLDSEAIEKQAARVQRAFDRLERFQIDLGRAQAALATLNRLHDLPEGKVGRDPYLLHLCGNDRPSANRLLNELKDVDGLDRSVLSRMDSYAFEFTFDPSEFSEPSALAVDAAVAKIDADDSGKGPSLWRSWFGRRILLATFGMVAALGLAQYARESTRDEKADADERGMIASVTPAPPRPPLSLDTLPTGSLRNLQAIIAEVAWKHIETDENVVLDMLWGVLVERRDALSSRSLMEHLNRDSRIQAYEITATHFSLIPQDTPQVFECNVTFKDHSGFSRTVKVTIDLGSSFEQRTGSRILPEGLRSPVDIVFTLAFSTVLDRMSVYPFPDAKENPDFYHGLRQSLVTEVTPALERLGLTLLPDSTWDVSPLSDGRQRLLTGFYFRDETQTLFRWAYGINLEGRPDEAEGHSRFYHTRPVPLYTLGASDQSVGAYLALAEDSDEIKRDTFPIFYHNILRAVHHALPEGSLPPPSGSMYLESDDYYAILGRTVLEQVNPLIGSIGLTLVDPPSFDVTYDDPEQRNGRLTVSFVPVDIYDGFTFSKVFTLPIHDGTLATPEEIISENELLGPSVVGMFWSTLRRDLEYAGYGNKPFPRQNENFELYSRIEASFKTYLDFNDPETGDPVWPLAESRAELYETPDGRAFLRMHFTLSRQEDLDRPYRDTRQVEVLPPIQIPVRAEPAP